MNNLFDLVQNWAARLSYRIMRISGASDAALKRYLELVNNMKEADAAADKEISGHRNIAQIIIAVAIIAGGWFVYRQIKKYRA